MAYHAVCVQTQIRRRIMCWCSAPVPSVCCAGSWRGLRARESCWWRVWLRMRTVLLWRRGWGSFLCRRRMRSRQGRALGDGLGVNAVVDAAGVSEALRTALDAVRPGGRITKVGWGKEPFGGSLDPLVQKAVTLQGSFSHYWEIWERVLRLLASGRLDTAPLVDRIAPMKEWEDVFERMHERTYVKAILIP